MSPDELVRIEITNLTGEMTLEMHVEVAAASIVAHARGTHVTWQAEGVRVVMPASALESLKRALDRHDAPAPPEKSDETRPDS